MRHYQGDKHRHSGISRWRQKKDREAKRIFEKILSPKLLNLIKYRNIQIQKTQLMLSRINVEIQTPKFIVINMSNGEREREKILREAKKWKQKMQETLNNIKSKFVKRKHPRRQ